jgi:acyl-CoA thioesterase
MAVHVFDAAMALRPQGADRFAGHCGRSYWNAVGPFGGISAATMLNAVLQHPALLGEPVSLTVNFASGLAEGPFTISARAARTNRSTQHWMVELQQAGAQGGAPETVLTATVLTAVRRSTWSGSDVPMPEVPGPATLPPGERMIPLEWLQHYEVRPVVGGIPKDWDGAENDGGPDQASLSRFWMRDHPERPLDFCSLAALADVFYPRVFLRRAFRVPAGTVSMTVYFHAGAAMLRDCGSDYVLGQARGQFYHGGFFDQTAQLWNRSGVPLASSTQVVYYKE